MLEGVVTNGTGRRARIEEYRLAGKSGTAQITDAGSYSETDYVASFGGFGPVENPQLVGLVVLNTPTGDNHQGGRVAAPVFGRIMRLALNHLRVPGSKTIRMPLSVTRSDTDSTLINERVYLATDAITDTLPDLRGYSLRDAVSRLSLLGMRSQVQGSGIVVAQHPAAGAKLQRGATCVLRLASTTVGGRP